LALLIVGAWLAISPIYLGTFFVIFVIGLGSILWLAFHAPGLALLGGPELPPASRITAAMRLLSSPRPLSAEAMVIESDPMRPPLPLSAEDVAKSDS
jgi:hypothetical protein